MRTVNKKEYTCCICGKKVFRWDSQIHGKICCSHECRIISRRAKVEDDLIYDLYFNQKLSKYKIQEKLNISYGVIYNVFKRNEWQFRNKSEANSIGKTLNLDKNKIYDFYINKRLTLNQVANKFNCSVNAIKSHLTKYNIKKRTKSEALKGKNNPNWHGGITQIGYSYKFNRELREQIRNRDNHICQNCGMTEKEHLIVRGRILDVHHVDYNKQNCKEDNLITVCCWCNTRANFNRDYWYAFYKYIINEKFSEVK